MGKLPVFIQFVQMISVYFVNAVVLSFDTCN